MVQILSKNSVQGSAFYVTHIVQSSRCVQAFFELSKSHESHSGKYIRSQEYTKIILSIDPFLVNLFTQTGIDYKTLNGDVTALGLELFVNTGGNAFGFG